MHKNFIFLIKKIKNVKNININILFVIH